MPAPNDPAFDPYAAVRLPDFRRFLIGSVLSILGMQMQNTAVGWEIYQRTDSPLMLGYVGLAQVIPFLTFALMAGHVADRLQRTRVAATALTAMMACSLGLAALSILEGPLWAMYVCLFVNGTARSFLQPAKTSLVPQIVPRDKFASAVAWNMSGFQLASVLGPALGGTLIGFTHHAGPVYLCDAVLTAVFVVALSRITPPPTVVHQVGMSVQSLLAGIAFVWQNKVLLGAMALDMFAVLLGGATALLPVYAKEILNVGPKGLGWLLAADAAGALVMSIALAHLPPFKRAGRALLLAVAAFGLAIICFGLSRSFPLSIVALFLTGVADNVSVVVRHTLVQMLTPDEMRGRVSAVNGMFIGASNELGAFESGLVARFTSPTISVVGGGLGTLVVVAVVALGIPRLRRYGRLDGR